MNNVAQLIRKLRSHLHEEKRLYYEGKANIIKNTSVDFGWGRLLFANTYHDSKELIKDLLNEEKGKRNMAFYVREPQKLIYESKGKLFLDPSFSYRLDLVKYIPKNRKPPFTIRFLTKGDIPAVNKVYEESGALLIGTQCTINNQHDPSLTYFIAESEGKVIGVMTGIDHAELFHSPKESTSIWGLCISKDARKKGLGRSLMGYIAKHYKTRGRRFLDLSVLCKNKAAIALYEKMGFVRMNDCFCVKTKNEINSGLYY